jgi:hypothetical protein
LAKLADYYDFDHFCPNCGGARRRVRDRSCYSCHLIRGRENFNRMKAGIAPVVARNRASHLDLLERQRAEKQGECSTRTFGSITATRWPTGRLEVHFPNGTSTPDFANAASPQAIWRAALASTDLQDVLAWAGWF